MVLQKLGRLAVWTHVAPVKPILIEQGLMVSPPTSSLCDEISSQEESCGAGLIKLPPPMLLLF